MRTFSLVAAVVLASAVPAAAEPAPRNVLLMIGDDVGPDLGCYGGFVRTPRLDALAAGGTRFTHAFASVASCSPSRATIFTGLPVHACGQYGLAHAEHNVHSFASVRSLPAILRDAGYRAAILGKNHVLPKEAYPFETLSDPDMANGRGVAGMARAARKFFAACGDRPFALVVGFVDAHRAGPGWGNDRAYPGVEETRYRPEDVAVPPFLPDIPEARAELAEYAQALSRLDGGVGLILDALRETGNADRTLVLFASDNGIPFAGAKTTLYDAGLRLPLLIAAPGRKDGGTTCRALASWTDLLPTILDWTGTAGPEGLPGRSLLPVLGVEDPPGWDAVFASHVEHEATMYYPMRAVRTRRYKYILNLASGLEFPFASDLWNSRTWQAVRERKIPALGRRPVDAFLRRPREELYDLEAEPHEAVNVAADPAHATALADLRARLRRWQEATRDPWLVKYEHE